jgi:sigma-B regulation protein RsbU (phosphoserine phosphatase)
MADRARDQRGFFKYFEEFRRTIAADLGQGDIGGHVRRDMRDLYDFYVDEERRARWARLGTVARWIRTAAWLVWNVILKLTPTRRLLALIALLLLFVSGANFGNEHVTILLNASVLSFLILAFVLMLELKDKLLARDELAVGRAVQLALLPGDQPVLTGWDIWLYTRPSNDVGGDLVDYLRYPDERLGIMLGDVAGKGLGAALLMAKLQATIRAIALEGESLSDLGEQANRILCRDGLPGRFATLVYLEITPDADVVRVLNAGHMPPKVTRGAAVEELPPVALPLGVGANAIYQDQAIAVAPGDMLVAYSDGLTEARDVTGEFFGDERVRQLVRQVRSFGAAEAGSEILKAIEGFVGTARLEDDLSLAVLKRKSD